MKTNKLTIICCTALSLFLSACSDWFDISPKTDVKAEDLFETESGFQSALAGIYIAMTNQNSYGANYTFGQLDKMVQYYDRTPGGQQVDPSVIFQYDEENQTYNSKQVLANMWSSSYNLIANANNLLSWLDKNGERVIRSEEERDMIRGEALALRGFLHFDLLRLWGPFYRSDSTALSIPYRLVADASRQPLLPANQIVRNILADLSTARELLNFEKGTSLADSDRRFRLNYYAITALMARVCNYRNDKASALAYAEEVINDCGLGLMDNCRTSPALFGETIFAINIYEMSDTYSSLWAVGPTFNTQLSLTQTKLAQIFETSGVGSNDMRARRNEGFLTYDDTNEAISRKYITNEDQELPLIRLSEMYYIMCECSPLNTAADYINEVRQKRGISRSYNYSFINEQERLEALNLEYRKDFYAEGQYFHFLKLHEMSTYLNCPIASGMTARQYVFPLPDAEKEYGWTDSMSDTNNGDASEQ